MLKVLANIEELKKGLSQTSSIANRYTSMPIMANVLLEGAAGRLTLTATDLEITFQCSYDADVLDEGSLTVPAKILSDIVSSLRGTVVFLEEKENLILNIECDNFSTDIFGMSPEEFPRPADTGAITFTDFPGGDLVDSITKTNYSVATGNTNYNLAGVFWVKEPVGDHEVLKLVSTDNNRLNIATLATDNLEAFLLDEGILVSRKSLTELKSLAEKNDRVSLGVNANNLVARTPNSIMIMRLLNGKFPMYQSLIPKEEGYIINLDRKEFSDTLKRISLLSSDKYRVVYFKVNEDSLVLYSRNSDVGEAQEKIIISHQGPFIHVGFDPKCLLEPLGTLKSEKVKLSIINSSRPAVITGEADPGYMGIVSIITPREDDETS
ncbi:MAG: DNA polymerase III subunit beta [Deltaproteobacteria bacterium]|jgi:DNA polymerase-3 subunit beta|nr:DNA polymerase III subunit beta [Deltaproteobacteria bacterium]